MHESTAFLSVDSSNDSGLEKVNPVTIRLFDLSWNNIVTHFLDMCTSTSGTVEGIFTVIDNKMKELLQSANPCVLCTSVSVDNTSVNIGVRDSLKTRVTKCNPAIFFNGCPWHILHNAAQKAAESFAGRCGFNVEELVIDLYYRSEKSTKRKNELWSSGGSSGGNLQPQAGFYIALLPTHCVILRHIMIFIILST